MTQVSAQPDNVTADSRPTRTKKTIAQAIGCASDGSPPLHCYNYQAAISVYNQNIQWAEMAATSPPQKWARMALGVRSR